MGGLTDDRIFALLTDRAGALWIGTFEGGLNRLDPHTGRFTSYKNDPADPTSLSGNGVTTIYEDRKGVLWVGVYRGGLNRFDPSTGTFQRYASDPATARVFPTTGHRLERGLRDPMIGTEGAG